MEISAEEMIEDQLPARKPVSDVSKVDSHASPIATIITAWVDVEKAAKDATMRVLPTVEEGGRTMPYSTVLRNVEALERSGRLSPDVRPLIRDLAKIRNQAVHRPDETISREALEQFVANADWAAAELQKIQ